MYRIPIDNYDDGMETTDDDFDFGSDLEERAATVPSAGLMRSAPAKVSDNKNQRQNRAASSPKKVIHIKNIVPLFINAVALTTSCQ